MATVLFIVSALAYSIMSWLLIPSELEQFIGIILPRISPTQAGIAFLIITLTLYTAYILIIRRTVPNRPTPTASLSVPKIALISTAFFISLPILSKDIYKYAFTARIVNHYRANPLSQAPSQFPQDPWLPVIDWETTVSAYGPLWALLAALATLPVVSNLFATIFSIKIVIAAFHAATAYLIYRFTRDRPDSRRLTLLYALNPLILLETLGSSHNDIVMTFFLLVSLIYMKQNRLGISLVFWLASLLVKQISLALAPLYLISFVTDRDFSWFLRYSLGALTLLALATPFRTAHGISLGINPWYFIWVYPFVLIRGQLNEIKLGILASFLLTLSYIPELSNAPHLSIWTTLALRITGMLSAGFLVVVLLKRTNQSDTIQSNEA